MGITSSLFFSSGDSEKQTLHRRITPTKSQFEEQQDRWNALAEHLISDLLKRTGYTLNTWLQGSYKFGTQIRPVNFGEEFDIDLGVYFLWEGQPKDGKYGPKQLKGIIQDSLKEYSHDDVIEVVSPPKEKCARIIYKSSFHIDIPGYHLNPKEDTRALATENDTWKDSDPKAIYIWFKDSLDDDFRSRARRLIRYFKCWAGLNFEEGADRPSSILITVLVTQAILDLADGLSAADDDALYQVIESILKRLNTNFKVFNPVDSNELLLDSDNNQAGQLLNEIERFRVNAQEALDSAEIITAAHKWTNAFGHFFPLPDIDELDEESQADSYSLVKSIIPEIAVKAIPRTNRSRQFNKINMIGPIPKECDIYFEITNAHEFPNNCEIEWIVRNEGEEAEYKNDLGHRAGASFKSEEHSAYKGVHYMDCIVKQHGNIIGLRRVPVEITGVSMPPRNPSKKPAWSRLRGKR